MIKRLILGCLATLALASLPSCKTNEENYRKAYETARQRESQGLEDTVYDRIRREARGTAAVVDGDTIQMKREYVTPVPDQGLKPGHLRRYNVVVGQFKQLFHARSMAKRFAAGGYTGTFIVQTREPLYYVVAVTSDSASVAARTADSLRVESPVTLRDPFPWILYPTNR